MRGRGRGHGRGRGRKPARGRARAAEAVVREGAEVPPPADNVEGIDVELENTDEMVPPPPTPEMIHQVLTYLSGLSDQGQAPPVPETPTIGEPHAAVVAPRIDSASETGVFPKLPAGPVMTSDQHEMFVMFLKLKPPVFKGLESEDAYDFLVDCHEMLHKLGIVDRFGVEFVTFQFRGDAKIF